MGCPKTLSGKFTCRTLCKCSKLIIATLHSSTKLYLSTKLHSSESVFEKTPFFVKNVPLKPLVSSVRCQLAPVRRSAPADRQTHRTKYSNAPRLVWHIARPPLIACTCARLEGCGQATPVTRQPFGACAPRARVTATCPLLCTTSHTAITLQPTAMRERPKQTLHRGARRTLLIVVHGHLYTNRCQTMRAYRTEIHGLMTMNNSLHTCRDI